MLGLPREGNRSCYRNGVCHMNAELSLRCFAPLCLLLAACANVPRGRSDFLAVVDRTGATEADVIEALGPPFARYDENRVLAYRLGAGKEGYYIARLQDCAATQDRWVGVKYDLILEIDNGVLVRHQLIEVRPDSHAPANTPAH